MQLFKEKSHIQLLAVNSIDKQSLLLFVGAIFIALLIGIVAEIFGEVLAILVFFLFFFTIIAIGNYRYGILIAISLLPLSSTSFIPKELFGVTGFNPFNVALLFSAISLLLAWLNHPRKNFLPKWPLYFWLYLGILGLAALQGSFHAPSIPAYFKTLQIINFDSSGGYLRDCFLKPVLILTTAFMLSVVVKNAHYPSLYLIPLLGSAIVLPIIVIAYIAISGVSLSTLAASNARGFLSVTGMHANELGLMFNMAFALALFCFFSASGILRKWMLGITCIILTVAIVLTFSRGAYLGLLAVVAYALFTQRRFRTMLVILLLVTIVVVFFIPEAVIERASIGLANGSVDDISAGRVNRIWQPLLPEILSSPLIGHGLSSILWSESAQRHTILPVGHTHSAYLGAILDLGIFGAIVIFLFFRHMWQLFMNLARNTPEPILRGFFRGATACILLLLIQGLTDDSFTPTRTQSILWLSYGMAIGLVTKAQNQAISNQPRVT